jgi:hypothetical protein
MSLDESRRSKTSQNEGEDVVLGKYSVLKWPSPVAKH